MKVVVEPQKEEVILKSVRKEATAEEVHEGLIARAECCVDHLCGCK